MTSGLVCVVMHAWCFEIFFGIGFRAGFTRFLLNFWWVH
jgi:hypothetical protein